MRRRAQCMGLSWLGKPGIGASVCLYAQVLGLDGYAAVLRVGLWPTTPP
jgi:hypothetical protein